MKKKFLWLLLAVCSSISAEEHVRDYFYRNDYYRYIYMPESDSPQESQVTFGAAGYEPIMQATIKMWIEGYIVSSSTTYAYDIGRNAVFSTGQIYSNMFGKSKSNDYITILALPFSKGRWFEERNETMYYCTSNWVYISYQTEEGKEVVEKAIKMSKTNEITRNGKTENLTRFSYWTKNNARVAECGYFDTSKEVIVTELASFISVYPRIKEVSEKEYKTYLLRETKRKAEEERARKEKQYQEFVRNLEPQSLKIANREAASKIDSFFLQLEEQRYEKMILDGLSNLNEYSTLYIDFPLASEFYIDAPETEKDTIASFISDLIGNNILKLPAFVTEPVTGRECEVPQFLNITKSVEIVSFVFDVVKQKDSWRLTNKKDSMPADLAEYIIQAANNVYATNRKAKKQQIHLRIMNIDDVAFKVWYITYDTTDSESATYTCLDSIGTP